MVIAMSVWQHWDFDWLQHGRCSGSCTQEDLGFKNLVFNTASSNGGDNDGGNDNGGEGSGENNGGGTTGDIAAGFAAIRNNPHYSST
jgi:hypothetical protein